MVKFYFLQWDTALSAFLALTACPWPSTLSLSLCARPDLSLLQQKAAMLKVRWGADCEISIYGGPICLICHKAIAETKQYNLIGPCIKHHSNFNGTYPMAQMLVESKCRATLWITNSGYKWPVHNKTGVASHCARILLKFKTCHRFWISERLHDSCPWVSGDKAGLPTLTHLTLTFPASISRSHAHARNVTPNSSTFLLTWLD